MPKETDILIVEFASEGLRLGRMRGKDLTLKFIPCATSGAASLKQLEDVVYNDDTVSPGETKFHMITDTLQYLIMPEDIHHDVVKLSAESLQLGAVDRFVECSIFGGSYSIGFEIDDEEDRILSFAERTFGSPMFTNDVWGAISYHLVHDAALEAGPTLHINARRDGIIDLVATAQGKLMLATSHVYRSIADALYHIIHAWKLLEMDALNDTLRFAGDSHVLSELVPQLKSYLEHIEPEVMPEFNIIAEGGEPAEFHNLILTAYNRV